MNVYARLLFALVLVATVAIADSASTISNEVLATRIIYGAPPLILDVRTPEEYVAGHVPGAINIPHDQLAERYVELPQPATAEVVVYCRTGKRAAIAEQILTDLGFSNVVTLEGHWLAWSDATLNSATGPLE